MTHVSRPRAFTQSAARFVVCSLGLTGLSACDSPVRRFADPLLGDAGVLASSTTSDAGDGQAGDAQTAAPAASALTSDSDSGSPGSSLGADSVDTRTEGAASNPERTTEAEVSSGSEMGDGGTAETNPVETGTGEAEARCGDGALQDGEECDDGALEPGDGCDAACQLEPGFSCDGAGTDSCRPNCGNGVLDDGEACDDGNARDGDGCSASCDLEAGFTCNGGLDCTANCGDGRVVGAEAQAGGCDDGNTHDGDGCDSACRTEAGWSCAGEPSACEATCGDGALQGSEACDDSNGESGDGCDACQIETGWTCTGSPSVCSTRCGDGKIGGSEACDDGNTQDGDGCDSACRLESGWICEGEPTTCRTECGDGMKRGSEACDDGNRLNGDGCNSSCRTESGWSCSGSAPTVCTDVNECASKNVCGPGEWICSNTSGSHHCECGGDHAVYGTYCGCRPQSPTNLLANANFDGGSWGAWEPVGSTSSSQRLDPDDADACKDSGSVFVEFDAGDRGLIAQCVDIQPNTTYSLGFRYLRQAGIGLGCQWVVYSGTCAARGSFINLFNHSTAVSTATDPGWRATSTSFTSPAEAGNMDLSCGAVSKGTNSRTTARMDQFYLNAAGDQF